MTRLTILHLLACAAGCAGDSLATVGQPAIATNAIATNAIATNAIATNAIATNAIATNAIATNAIATNGIATNGILTGAVADPVIALALEDPNARVFMRYLVGCALTPDQAVTWTNRHGTLFEMYRGALGLCPTWQKDAPDAGCRERVSACILARNNAFGVSVAFSIRGKDADNLPLSLGDHVPPHDHVPFTNTPVASVQRCRKAVAGPARDCGWHLAAIGVCEPMAPVSIAAGNHAQCHGEWLGVQGARNEMLRVCRGTSACDAAYAIATVDDACGSRAPEVSFACPREGYYAVMTGAYDSRDVPDGEIASTPSDPTCVATVCEESAGCCTQWDATCDALAETACRYPASEARVFRWREGSFYGDLFGDWNLDPAKPQVRVDPEHDGYALQSWDGNAWIDDGGQLSHDFVGIVFPSMFACASSNWTEPEAYAHRRVCAGPDPADPKAYTRNCAASYVGPCATACATLDDGPIARDYDAAHCAGHQGLWATPMTTLLAHPCAALPDPSLCGTVSPEPILGGW